ncbi:uncharacterized protein DS421_19g663530 [Arachis hypogaea]|uniref:Uncharacterized protein n=1 Tax=Arachis hypogaea TaxID=3818 RepID=A0A6B9VEI9_ARAHY|nr:uncharacterized protein DS421_19g663530 [Arachis hypogaea]
MSSLVCGAISGGAVLPFIGVGALRCSPSRASARCSPSWSSSPRTLLHGFSPSCLGSTYAVTFEKPLSFFLFFPCLASSSSQLASALEQATHIITLSDQRFCRRSSPKKDCFRGI